MEWWPHGWRAPEETWVQRLFRNLDRGGHVPSLLWKASKLIQPNWMRNYLLGKPTTQEELVQDFDPASAAMGMVAPLTVRWRPGLEYPSAFVHRATHNPREILNLGKAYQRGDQLDRAATLMTPGYWSTFEPKMIPFGAVFHVKNPRNLLYVSPVDAWSERVIRTHPTPESEKLGSLAERLDLVRENLGAGHPRRLRYQKAFLRLNKLWNQSKRREEALAPDEEIAPMFINRESEPLTNLFAKEAQYARARKSTQPFHHEVGYRIGDPSELAGIRMPLNLNKLDVEDQVMARELMDFARERKVPLFRIDPLLTRTGYNRMVADPMAGDWLRKGRNIYSSRQREYLGE